MHDLEQCVVFERVVVEHVEHVESVWPHVDKQKVIPAFREPVRLDTPQMQMVNSPIIQETIPFQRVAQDGAVGHSLGD
jgi:hypothetical protein